ncbi:XdhC family protein [Kosmotoga pacifica]|uniref:XdhC family protein n=1 Tax=Kosmotoga pacifica TaxID=1330330 RepID=UPI00069C8CB5|nr:XdhC family protein [Kosmotoga pacifica]
MKSIKGLLSALSDSTEFAIAFVISTKSSSFRRTGETYAIDERGKIYGSLEGAFGEFILQNLKKAIYNGESFTERFTEFREDAGKHGATCGERTEVFFMYQGKGPRVHIFGAGNLTPLLLSVLQIAGFSCTVIDDDERFLSEIEDVEKYMVDYEKMTGFPEVKPGDFCVIVTRGHMRDLEALKFCLEKSPRYIGMIGSEKKNAELKERFFSEGYTEEDWKRIRTPVGLDIGASSPGEIAVAIAAEIILERRKGFVQGV